MMNEPKPSTQASTQASTQNKTPPQEELAQAEIQPVRPDPVRYGDWEIGGRCIDF